jgi:hypothetical protein
MYKLIVLLLITNFCFSQEKLLTISEIDSICLIHQNYGYIDNNYTISNEKKENIGNGYFELKTYIFPKKEIIFEDEPKTEDLVEKVVSEIEKNQLIKGTCSAKNNYNNSDKSEVNCEFYYNKSELFYVKVILTKETINSEPLVEKFEFYFDKKVKLKNVKNILGMDLENFIKSNNKQIKGFYN